MARLRQQLSVGPFERQVAVLRTIVRNGYSNEFSRVARTESQLGDESIRKVIGTASGVKAFADLTRIIDEISGRPRDADVVRLLNESVVIAVGMSDTYG